MTLELQPHLIPVLQKAQEQFGGELSGVARGEFSDVLLVERAPVPYVVKVFRQPRWEGVTAPPQLFAQLEASALQLLESAEPSPVEIPHLLASDIEESASVTMTAVPGASVTYETTNAFSNADQRLHGEKIGAFVGWLNKAVSMPAYADIFEPLRPIGAEPPVVTQLKKTQGQAELFRQKGQYALADVITELQAFAADNAEAIAGVPVLGHNDLHQHNLIAADSGQSILSGIIDFMLLGPSTAERELRYMGYYGPAVATGLKTGFENATGKALDGDVLAYWQLGQIVTSAARKIHEGAPIRPGVIAALERHRPDKNWAQLYY